MEEDDPRAEASAEAMRAMILSVGGSPAPIVASLNAQQPALVCFFVSPESRQKIREDILDKLAYQPAHHDWIETPSAEDLLVCYRILAQELPRLADKWKVPLREFVADFNGGTKTMSAALPLATVQVVGRYTYVGGTERTMDGLGMVVDGKERMLRFRVPGPGYLMSGAVAAAATRALGEAAIAYYIDEASAAEARRLATRLRWAT